MEIALTKPVEALASTMDSRIHTLESMLLAFGRAYQWVVLYGPAHPVSIRKIREIHSTLIDYVNNEPDRALLIGISRDKVLYRDQFIGKGNEIILNMTERLYTMGIATICFDAALSEEELYRYFEFLHRSGNPAARETPQEFQKRTGIATIRMSQYNYRELLSRKIFEGRDPGGAPEGADDLLRYMMTSDLVPDDDAAKALVGEIARYPELLPAILPNANLTGEDDPAPFQPGPQAGGADETVSPEVLRNLLGRLGPEIRDLSEAQRMALASTLSAAARAGSVSAPGTLEVGGGSLAGAPAQGYEVSEFLDLMGNVLAVEDKATSRFRKIYEILSDEPGSEAPASRPSTEKESLRAKTLYSQKAWETIDRLILSRTEVGYVAKDHVELLETISENPQPFDPSVSAASIAPPLRATVEPAAQKDRLLAIYLDLLPATEREEDFLDLLEEVRKFTPNLVSRRELDLLGKVLLRLNEVSGRVRAEWRGLVDEVIAGTDFDQMVDIFLDRGSLPEVKESIAALISEFGAMAADAVLRRLLAETNPNSRRGLLELARRLGPPGIPRILDQAAHPKWYFVRNLCTILGEIGDARAVPFLVGGLAHEDQRVRRRAAAALGTLRSSETVPFLGKVLLGESRFFAGKDDAVRIEAASALFRIRSVDALRLLSEGMNSRSSPVREHCRNLAARWVDCDG